MDKDVEFLGIARAVQDQGQWRWDAALVFDGCTVVLTIGSIMTRADLDEVGSLVTLIIAVILSVIAALLRWWSERRYALGRKIQLQAELAIGLGWPIRSDFNRDMRHDAGDRARRKGKAKAPSDYWATTTTPGPARLAEMKAESAWWTYQLARTTRLSVWVALFTLVLLAGIVAIRSIVQPLSDGTRLAYAKVVLSAMFSPAIFGLFRWALSLEDEIAEIKELNHELKQIGASEKPLEADVVRIVGQYEIVLARSYPTPYPVYRIRKARLEDLWRDRV